MAGAVYFFQAFRTHGHVDLRGVDAPMPKQLLDVGKPGTPFQHVRGGRVAKRVWRDPARQACRLRVFPDRSRGRLPAHVIAVSG